LIYKYENEFLNNLFNKNDSQLLKLNDFIKNNTHNYIAIGHRIMIYFYKKNNKYYVYITPMLNNDVLMNYNKIIKYVHNCNIMKILTKYKYDSNFKLYKIEDNYFKLIKELLSIKKLYDFIYQTENFKNKKILIYGTCLGGNIIFELYKYIKSKYHNTNNIKLFTFETCYHENNNIKNLICVYTNNSSFYLHSLKNNYKIDYVYNIDKNEVLNYIFNKRSFLPILNFNSFTPLHI